MTSVIAAFAQVNRVNLEVCRVAAILLTAAIAIIVALGVFFRYVLNDSLSWAEELSKFCMLWLAFIGSPIALRFGNHIAIELLPSALPRRLGEAIRALVMMLVIAFLTLLVWKSWAFAWNGWSQTAIAIGDISMFWIFVSIPVGAASMWLVAVQLLLEHLMRAGGGDPPEDPFMAAHFQRVAGHHGE